MSVMGVFLNYDNRGDRMPLTKIEAENFTVFENVTIPFSQGLNVLVGENGMGKTHIMKVLYSVCCMLKLYIYSYSLPRYRCGAGLRRLHEQSAQNKVRCFFC